MLPHIARHADDIAFLKGMHVRSNNHGPALYEINTGLTRVGFPSVGSWVTYGLGSENENLAGFVIMPDPRGSIEGGPYSWSSGFLPGAFQGTPIRTGANPILHVSRLPNVSAHLRSEDSQRKIQQIDFLGRDDRSERRSG